MKNDALSFPSSNDVRSRVVLIEDNGARPFLKWVGGKTQLIGTLVQHIPSELGIGDLDTYVEPFVGGGAFFFYLVQHFAIQRAVIADANADLILAYRTVKYSAKKLITTLKQVEQQYLALSESKRSAFYYETRSSFNSMRPESELSGKCANSIERTSQLLFLNKTCFNGLFRVNSSGSFNVAFGKYDNPQICDEKNLAAVAKVLQRCEILRCDFEDLLPRVSNSTFLYLDPPYVPISETSNFTSYSASTFTMLDQQRLAKFCSKSTKRGARVLLSNSDRLSDTNNATLFHEEYPDFSVVRVAANRMVNCKADRRGKISELLFKNY